MKRIIKNPAPNSLIDYSSAVPNSTWEQMRNDGVNNGQNAYHDCRRQAVEDQQNLCAYCELKITSDDQTHCSIEHFHPASDKSKDNNWALDWNNMLAVCDGGSRSKSNERIIFPLPDNLSCDSHKDRMIQTGKLPIKCEGHILNPLEIPAFPNLFTLDKGTGFYKSNDTSCTKAKISGNKYETTTELVDNTIDMLNLNCSRLAAMRRMLIINIDQNKKQLRLKHYTPAEVPTKLIERYFTKKWPEFFTALRCCLGETAEKYLESINYKG